MSADDDIDLRLQKIYPGVIQRVVPLAPLGDAEGMEELCPSLSLTGRDKKPLGTFLPYYRKDIIHKLNISESDFNAFPNSSLLDMMSLYAHCGDSPFVDE
jgi:hypothetical protein